MGTKVGVVHSWIPRTKKGRVSPYFIIQYDGLDSVTDVRVYRDEKFLRKHITQPVKKSRVGRASKRSRKVRFGANHARDSTRPELRNLKALQSRKGRDAKIRYKKAQELDPKRAKPILRRVSIATPRISSGDKDSSNDTQAIIDKWGPLLDADDISAGTPTTLSTGRRLAETLRRHRQTSKICEKL